MREIVQFVNAYDDLDMAWIYHAQGWDIIKRLDGNHGYWSWLAISPAVKSENGKKGGRG